ncbi:hypothetical protein DPF85_01090 [Limosilactobacillus fermentum]|uniref:hypothetical protein n=1 Tax=Limosilactobacillus fermentum TaxID=1613 RepID=UPI000DBF3AA7|nr:hypothetical protein [Limosilactobacillus fermentum]RAM10748.1 hypothetical protein DPF85_01090 [Limosilactobacillus fermentum]
MEKMTEQELVGLKYLEMLRLMVVVKNLEQSIPELVDEITYIAHDSSEYQVKVDLLTESYSNYRIFTEQIIKDRNKCYQKAKEIMTSHRWDEVVSLDLAYNICDAGLMLADVLKDGGTDDGIRADFSDPR